MKIVIAPDSFKECLSSQGVADAIEAGLRKHWPEAQFIKVPVADGGEGTLQALVASTKGTFCTATVTDPLGHKIQASYGILGDGKTAVIEMAEASGLELVPMKHRNPLLTTSYGTGELILAALNKGVERIIVAIGGSAVNDGGAGMMMALGVRFLDEFGNPLTRGADALAKLATIDLTAMDKRLQNTNFMVACDVNNPLTEPKGASAVFGPQKGATPAMVNILDRTLTNYAQVLKKDLNVDIEKIPGAGAAGGMGAALLAFMDAKLKPGIDLILDTVQLSRHLDGATLVITGEGRIDSQTAHGKTPIGVARLAKLYDLPVIALSGSIGKGAADTYQQGIDAIFPVVHGAVPLSEALDHGFENLVRTAENIARLCNLPIR